MPNSELIRDDIVKGQSRRSAGFFVEGWSGGLQPARIARNLRADCREPIFEDDSELSKRSRGLRQNSWESRLKIPSPTG
jgi:hypothetical protein